MKFLIKDRESKSPEARFIEIDTDKVTKVRLDKNLYQKEFSICYLFYMKSGKVYPVMPSDTEGITHGLIMDEIKRINGPIDTRGHLLERHEKWIEKVCTSIDIMVNLNNFREYHRVEGTTILYAGSSFKLIPIPIKLKLDFDLPTKDIILKSVRAIEAKIALIKKQSSANVILYKGVFMTKLTEGTGKDKAGFQITVYMRAF